ncbi:hypothetical protein DV735_g5357, partial [Chaetothyriales sp. CBS 134920]
MANPPYQPDGFPLHLRSQLEHCAQQLSQMQPARSGGRGRGDGAQSRGRYSSYSSRASLRSDAPPDHLSSAVDDFSHPGYQPSIASFSSNASSQLPPLSHVSQASRHHQRQADAREFFNQARGGSPVQHPPRGSFPSSHSSSQPYMYSDSSYPRRAHRGSMHQSPPSSLANSRVFSSPSYGLRHQVMAQSDYLNGLQMEVCAKYQLKPEESLAKENFRRRLEAFFQQTLRQKYPDIDSSEIRLKCYGSLNNGFGLANCDMDLLLALPQGFTLSGRPRADGKALADSGTTEAQTQPQEPESFELGWLLEDVLLEAGIGAKLLTNTRVPILKVCETPDSQLLRSLRESSKEARADLSGNSVQNAAAVAPYPPVLDMTAVQAALSDLDDAGVAAQVSIPDSPKRAATTLEFSDEHGITCDVNFSNFVALINTRLLREYCNYDPRVAEVGVFVKTWAKARDINTPYWGTLSSYGYVLMVLHYLMNVVKPPVIPNLQALAVEDDAWKPTSSVDLFEGKYDVRFWSDEEKIARFKSTAPRNRESAGHLIRGFFWYYSAKEGFNYKYDVISLRTRGGILRKQAKGWTEAKWADGNRLVRQRYLLAIEDPFETEHNVARVVGFNGLGAIKEEFRRAWDIISRIEPLQLPESDLLEPVEKRGDTLRKDQDFARQKVRARREAEAKERELRKASLPEGFDFQQNGMFYEDESSIASQPSGRAYRRCSSNQLLTGAVGNFQDSEQPHQIKRGRYRVKDDTDSESDAEDEVAVGKRDSVTGSNDASEQPSQAQAQSGGPTQEAYDWTMHFCDPAEILASYGKDAQGRPVAWDLSTHDGRWLQWRDNKIRSGRWRQARTTVPPNLMLIDKMCPYDPLRPRPKSRWNPSAPGYVSFALKPPVPMKDVMEPVTQKPRSSLEAPAAAESATPRAYYRSRQQVGLLIPWDISTRGGRWLRKRDAMVRTGIFKQPRPGAVADLHDRFPYDPSMTRSQLDAYNQELRTYHMDAIERLNEADTADGLSELSPSYSRPSTPSMFHRAHDPRPRINDYEPDKPQNTPRPHGKAPSQGPPQAGQTPDPAFVRKSRLAFFAQKERKTSDDADEGGSMQDSGGNIRKLMEDAAIVLIFYLCIAAMHKHRQPFAFYTLYWAAFLAALEVLGWLNHRLAYGPPRPRPRQSWDNEVVVITGGARGLGRVLAESLARRGVKVAILDLAPADGEACDLMDSADLVWHVCDVARPEQVARALALVVDRLGAPTVLVNNAAAAVQGRALVGDGDAARTLQVNALAHVTLLHACMPYLLRSPTGAHVVTISSVLAHLAPAHLADYAASKAAASAIHLALVHEIMASGDAGDAGDAGAAARIKPLLVETGQLDTPLFASVTRLPWYADFFAPVLDPKDVADAIIRVVASGEGGVLRMPLYASVVGAGWYAVLPALVKRLVRWLTGIDAAVSTAKKEV